MQSIYTKEFCSSIKKDKIISFVGKWTKLEMIRWGETNHLQPASILSPTWEYGAHYLWVYTHTCDMKAKAGRKESKVECERKKREQWERRDQRFLLAYIRIKSLLYLDMHLPWEQRWNLWGWDVCRRRRPERRMWANRSKGKCYIKINTHICHVTMKPVKLPTKSIFLNFQKKIQFNGKIQPNVLSKM